MESREGVRGGVGEGGEGPCEVYQHLRERESQGILSVTRILGNSDASIYIWDLENSLAQVFMKNPTNTDINFVTS